jgi:apolipoprotein N-acyltransferase
MVQIPSVSERLLQSCQADHVVAARYGDAAALLAGAAMPLAFAPYGWWPVAILSLAVLFRLWIGLSPRHALLRGGLFGLGMFGFGIAWVQISLHQFGLPSFAFSVGVTALLVMVMAVYPALVGYVAQRWFNARLTVALLLVMPSLWTLGEWLRGWLFTGFPWLSVGYGQIDGPLAAFAPVAGVFSVSFVASLFAGALALLPLNRTPAATVFALLAAVVAALSFVQWTHSDGAPVRVVLVQGGIEQSQKWDPQMLEKTLTLYRTLSESHWGTARLIVWPETAIPAFGSEAKDFIAEMNDRAAKAGTDILIGVPLDDRDASGRISEYFNSIIVLGSNVGRYDKRHLVLLGEYPPFPSVLMPILRNLDIPMSEFSHGRPDQPPLSAAGLKLAPSICFEDAFGEELIDFLPDSQLLVNVSNDAWFGDSLAPHQHLQMARMRALETGRYLLRATNNGISAIVDPAGDIVRRSPQFIAHVLVGEVQPFSGATPYVALGNTPIVLIACLSLLLGWRAARADE